MTNGLAKTSDLTSYVAKSDVIPATGITGTAIATVGGKTIYAPVSEEGIQSETDPVFSASAAAGITTGDIASWNAKSSITPVNADWNATTGLSTILNKPTILDSGVLYADITGTTSLTSNVTYANIVAATPTKAVMLRRNGDIYQLAKAASSGLEFRVIKPLEIDEIVMTSSTITYNSYLTNVSGTTLTINE